MNYHEVYNTILEKIDKAIEEDKAHPLLLIGNYRTGEVMHLDNSALFDEFIEGDPEYEAMDVDPVADYSDQFAQFTESVKKGYTFGDYQEFVTLADRLKEFRDTVEEWQEKDNNPAYLCDDYSLGRITSVQCNGFRDDVYKSVCRNNDEFKELNDYIEGLQAIWLDGAK